MNQTLLSALNGLLVRLQEPSSRPAALRTLNAWRTNQRDESHPDGVEVRRLRLSTSVLDTHLDLLLAPSIFEPEDWSYTFLEGLLRYPPESLEGRELVELGCGSGWVSLALLKATKLGRVLALDLNPVAVTVCQINAWLNSYGLDGEPLDEAPLVTRFEARQADLLREVIEAGEAFDLVVGCIPQVLSPSPDFDPGVAMSELDDRGLYDLSNYFALQGVYEDQFGLGLLAKALEQAALVLKPQGRVVLNVAGRPGTKVVERMFSRRGYKARAIWTRRVKQAQDTNIGVLADLERRTGNDFEFFIGPLSQNSIGATTAHALREAGRLVWHDLRVVEARLQFDRDLRPFYLAANRLGYQTFLDQLDLSAISEEQVRFLRSLVDGFVRHKTAPYTDVSGGEALRQGISRYLNRHFEMGVLPEDLFVAPSRQELVFGLLMALAQPQDRVLLAGRLAAPYRKSLEKARADVVVANDDLEEIGSIASALAPKIVLLALSPEERRNHTALRRLVREATEASSLVVVDASDEFEITSSVHENPVLEAFGEGLSSERLLVVTGLIKNQVYPGLQPAFLLGAGENLLSALRAFAEATYSRVDTFTERYYADLFEEILAFQLRRLNRGPSSIGHGVMPLELSPRMKDVLRLSAFSEPPYAGEALRLDYGENELELPDRLAQGVLLGFTNLGKEVSDRRLAEEVAGFTAHYAGQHVDPDTVVFGNGVFPLLADSARALCLTLGRPARVALVAGHYGYLPPLFSLSGCEVMLLEGPASEPFRLEVSSLRRLPTAPDAIMLVNPNNPTGVFYEQAVLDELSEYAAEQGILLLCDEIFNDIDLVADVEQAGRAPRLAMRPGLRSLHFGGLSKVFAAGGLRVGWVFGTDRALLQKIRELNLTPLGRHARVATDVLLRGFVGEPPMVNAARSVVDAYLATQRRRLASQRQQLCDKLAATGARCIDGRPGGLFVLADVRGWFGRQVRIVGQEPLALSQGNVVETLEHHFGLRLNSSEWSASPGHLRACFSLSTERFEEALRRLDVFANALIA